MVIKIRIKNLIIFFLIAAILMSSLIYYNSNSLYNSVYAASSTEKKFIKYVEFNVPYTLMDAAMKYDIKSHDTDKPLNWIELIAYLAAKYGGNFSKYKSKRRYLLFSLG